MFSPETIRQMSDEAAQKAAREAQKPLFIWSEDDVRSLPFLGDYVPAGWRYATFSELSERPRNASSRDASEPIYFMVDATGFGADDEPALTLGEFYPLAKHSRFAWAIREVGQFQVVVAAYAQDPESLGIPAPHDTLDA